MSVISFREWEVWQNNTYFTSPGVVAGQFVLSITPSLMAKQTVEFIFEQIERIRQGAASPQAPADAYLSPLAFQHSTGPDGVLSLYKVAPLDTEAPIPPVLRTLLDELRALSLCLDFPLTCTRIEYEVPPGEASSGKVFVAMRKPLVRALAFEVDERAAAAQILRQHFADYSAAGGTSVQIASNHYITGMTLLGLEDQYPGLLDAAFMQFYQGCETLLLGAPRERVDDAKKRVAVDPRIPKSRDLQIVIAQVWKVRHRFFGHRGTAVPQVEGEVYQIAKQVLVARWLCRRLIDVYSGIADVFCREMRFYHAGQSEEFRGTVAELEGAFVIPGAAGEKVKIFHAPPRVTEEYVLK